MPSVTPDRDEIIRALQLLHEPGDVIELRALGVSTPEYRRPHRVSGYFNDIEALATSAVKLSPFAKGVYITLNHIEQALLARAANRIRVVNDDEPLTSDTNVILRRWLPIDCDPVRPASISSTDEEHATAIARAHEIREALTAEGWPPPILADSGNGCHLLYRVDLPNDDATRELLESVLKALAFRFEDSDVSIDQTVFNASRIWKAYGTPARKGDHTSDRPHRLARLLKVPE
jgi:hypothetical protein